MSNALPEMVLEKFQTRQARVAVIGLGYVGLPLAVVFAEAGYSVVGIDLDTRKVESIHQGESYIEDIPSARLAPLVFRDRESGSGEQAVAAPTVSAQSPTLSIFQSSAYDRNGPSSNQPITLSGDLLPLLTSPSWPSAMPYPSVCLLR